MKAKYCLAMALSVTSTLAFGHGGGLDKCGGHRDKKSGGYHVHNIAKLCDCNPNAEQCKAPTKKKN